MTENKKARGIKLAAASLAMVVVGSGAALAAPIPGTNAGEVLRGTDRVDTIHGYGGADLIYGYGERDTVWGGNEAGFGDKVLGGTAADRLVGQQGDDALYGEGGNDTLEGQYGDDLLVGGTGEDTLIGGPGADEVDAQDGRRDIIDLTGSGSNDVVYYDRGIDVFVTSSVESVGEGSSTSAAEAARATGAELSSQKPPEGLFEPHAKVLVDHEGEKLLVAEKRLEAHLAHGDEIIDPTGRAEAERGR
jgi:Ca2+-binding RTX toxin-like protein